jgi:DNA repair protein RecN (Recombination protein N)
VSLLELAVSDLALIDRLRISLNPGFTVITGETGAGKSLLIDALTLVLGGRADSALVRHGATTARVEALFERLPEPLICVREMSAAGRSLARIDDETVTVGRLAETAGPLVEIHGQHEQQRLLSSAWQRELLDAFGGHQALREAVAEAVGRWRENRAALAALEIDPEDLARRIELAEHAAEEIEAADLRLGEVEEIRTVLATASAAERVGALVGAIRELLVSDGAGARDRLALAARHGAELGGLDARYGGLAERIDGLTAEAEDVAVELGRVWAASEHDPGTVAAMEERLGRLYALLRKYGEDEAAVLEHARRARSELERLGGLEHDRATRQEADRHLEAEARRQAEILHGAREEAADRLGELVAGALAELGFRQARFEVRLTEAPLDATGRDEVSFLIAPNPGEPALPLARIASGGELSRVSLALKSVLAEADATPTLVFDEIDAGVGGRSADPIGRMLRRLAESHQVLCVTHLPQIAVHADAHLRITKRTVGDRTITEVHELDQAGRLEELATMLGGEAPGDASRDGARELLARAREDAHQRVPAGARAR